MPHCPFPGQDDFTSDPVFGLCVGLDMGVPHCPFPGQEEVVFVVVVSNF